MCLYVCSLKEIHILWWIWVGKKYIRTMILQCVCACQIRTFSLGLSRPFLNRTVNRKPQFTIHNQDLSRLTVCGQRMPPLAFACMIDWVRLNCASWNSSFSSNHRMKNTVSSALQSYIINVSICECSHQWAVVLSAIVLPINSPRSPLSCFTVRFTFILKEKNSISRFHHSSVGYSPPSLWKKPSFVFLHLLTV